MKFFLGFYDDNDDETCNIQILKFCDLYREVIFPLILLSFFQYRREVSFRKGLVGWDNRPMNEIASFFLFLLLLLFRWSAGRL